MQDPAPPLSLGPGARQGSRGRLHWGFTSLVSPMPVEKARSWPLQQSAPATTSSHLPMTSSPGDEEPAISPCNNRVSQAAGQAFLGKINKRHMAERKGKVGYRGKAQGRKGFGPERVELRSGEVIKKLIQKQVGERRC